MISVTGLARKFQTLDQYVSEDSDSYSFLPFRFRRLRRNAVIVTNLVGEYLVLSDKEFDAFSNKKLCSRDDVYGLLKAKHFLIDSIGGAALELLALKFRTKHHRVAQFTSLHMFVVSLRCDYSCPYCQVSRQSSDRTQFDMSEETAINALNLVFQSPSPMIKIEFQGGEPLLNFEQIQFVVDKAREINDSGFNKDLQFVIATNLSFLDDQKLDYIEENDIYISTSLDGPREIHNRNRPRPGKNGYELTIQNIERIRSRLGTDKISALMTTTELSLDSPEKVIDEYIEQGFSSIFLRSLSPYGFAVKTKQIDKYNATRWVEFFKRGLNYIIEINKNGHFFRENYTSIILEKILTPYSPGYVDLQNPSGIGISAVIYNYDGDVYASDEARMLAEMGDKAFKIGNVNTDSYQDIFGHQVLLNTLEDTVLESVPMCTDCAYLPYCGVDPVYHQATQGDVVGHKAISGFCEKNMAIFDFLFELLDDEESRQVLVSWIT